MIYSDKQYNISEAQLAKLKEALTVAQNRPTSQPWLKKAEVDALRSQISEIESKLTDYDLLKSGQISFSKSFALEELPHVLVQARIASGMSQTDLAQKLNMKPQQVQRYEATDYMGASLARLIQIGRILGVKASGIYEGQKQTGGSIFAWGDAKDIVWGQLPYKEMIKRKWFDVPRGADPVEKAKEYFLRAAGPQFATAYHRKKMRSSNVPNEYSLLAWQARVLDLARDIMESDSIAKFKMDNHWLSELVALTKLTDGPKRARQLLAQNGVCLITEQHLPESYLDGGAMLNENGQPVVALTLRYDRLDNFWFVLMHELGHVFLHLFDGLHFDFFDEEGAADQTSIEIEADKFALETLIPAHVWDQCLSRFALSEEAVLIDAKSLGIHPSIIAGRIRKERGDYSILSNLVGQGLVRSQFQGDRNELD